MSQIVPLEIKLIVVRDGNGWGLWARTFVHVAGAGDRYTSASEKLCDLAPASSGCSQEDLARLAFDKLKNALTHFSIMDEPED